MWYLSHFLVTGKTRDITVVGRSIEEMVLEASFDVDGLVQLSVGLGFCQRADAKSYFILECKEDFELLWV